MEVTGNLIAKLINGKLGKDFPISNFSIDTRNIQKNDVFVAFKGQNSDGHQYIKQALDHGASGALITDKNFFDPDLPLLLVDDALEALEKIAVYKREHSRAKFIGVTGSVGKTSTKELLKLAFSAHGKCFCTSGNYNNRLGVALSMASVALDDEFAIIEMGMDHRGEISPLSKLVRPHLSVITNVQPVHIENLGSISEIALEKASIVDGMEEGGICILNSSCLQLDLIKEYLQEKKIKYLLNAPVIEIKSKDNEIRSKLLINNKIIDFTMSTYQHHQVSNAALALMAVDVFGSDVEKSANNLQYFTAMSGRGEIIKFKDFTLIDDSYNASPLSMREAIINLNSRPDGKKLAIIGDMRELGDLSKSAHQEIYSPEIAQNIDSFILCGKEMSYLWPLLPKEKKLALYEDYHDLKKDLIFLIKGYNYILVKSSFGTGLINIVKEIKGIYV